MSKTIDVEMQILQDNLCELRKIAGWTAEVLANKLGTTKQTVSNIETQKVTLTRMQYIAIRSVFECETVARSDNTTLRKILGLLFGIPKEVYTEKREDIKTALISIAAIASAGITGLQLHSSAVSLLAPLGAIFSFLQVYSNNEPSLNWLLEHLEEPTDDNLIDITEDDTNEES